MERLNLNPSLFPAVDEPEGGAEAVRGLGGGRVRIDRLGTGALDVWPMVFGATLPGVARLWRIDRFTRLRDQTDRV